MSLGIKPFERGLHDLGTGGYAWMQPDGGWGWSNAGMMRLAPGLGEVGEFLQYCFSDFDFENIRQTLPTRTFEETLKIQCGDKDVTLKQVGPCHTRGDILVHVPEDKLMFTGDILFIEGHPILWAGPSGNWIDACDYILGLDLETIVPGHGPITDHRGVRAVRDYLVYVRDEARKRFDAGIPVYDAAMDISMTDYDAWGDGERIVVNVATLYREFGDAESPTSPVELFAMMAQAHKARRR